MTPKYWIRIALGMLLIFAVGMGINAAITEGKHQVSYIVEGSGPVSVPLLGMTFRLGDEDLGGIQRLRLLRSSPKHVDSAVVIVKLNDASAAQRFADCRLTVHDADNLSEKTAFFCADSTEAADLELVPFGHVEFMPTGEQVAIWLPADVVADLRDGGLDASGADSGDVDINAGEHGLQVKVNGKELVSINGDSAGGALTVRDANGKTIVRIRGDTSGASIHVTPERAGNPAQTRARNAASGN